MEAVITRERTAFTKTEIAPADLAHGGSDVVCSPFVSSFQDEGFPLARFKCILVETTELLFYFLFRLIEFDFNGR